MLAVEMLFYQQRIHGQFRIDGVCNACHLGHLFHYHCVVYSIVRIFSPREGAVILYQYSRCVQGSALQSALQLHFRFPFHTLLPLLPLSYLPCKVWHRGSNLRVSFRYSECHIRLAPGSSVSRVGVYHTADFRESLVEYHVRRCV